MEIKITKKQVIYFLLFTAILISVLPWLKEGIAATDDFRAHITHLSHMKNSVLEKGYVTFWMQELYSGWPIFQFYSLIPYFISIPFVILFNPVTALKYSIILSYFVCALSMFFAVKILFKDDEIAFVSSIAYLFSYYHFVDAGIRGAFNELWGYSFFPIVVALFIDAYNNPEKKKIILSIISVSLMVITHVPTTYMIGMTFVAYIIYKVFEDKKITKKNIKVIFSVLLGSLLISGFWLIPFLAESKNVNFDDFYSESGTKLIGLGTKTGLKPSQLFMRNFDHPGYLPTGDRLFYLGYSLIILALFSFLYKNRLSRFLGYLSVFLILTMLFPFIVNLIPLVSLIHFQFRLIVILAFALSIIAGTSAKSISKMFKVNKQIKFLIILGIAGLIIIDFTPGNKFNWVGQKDEYFINNPLQISLLEQISKEPGNFLVFSPTAQTAQLYHKKFELGFDWAGFKQGTISAIHSNYSNDAHLFLEGLQNNNINQSIFASQRLGYYGVKYIVLPCIKGLESIYTIAYTNNAYCAYKNQFYEPLIVSKDAEIKNVKFDTTEISFDATPQKSSDNSDVIVKVSYFEHWHAYINGVETKIESVFPKYMKINLNQGNQKVILKYKNTKLQIITKLISLISFILLIGLYFNMDERWLRKKEKKIQKKNSKKKKKKSQ